MYLHYKCHLHWRKYLYLGGGGYISNVRDQNGRIISPAQKTKKKENERFLLFPSFDYAHQKADKTVWQLTRRLERKF